MRKIKTGIVGYGISAKVFHIPFVNTLDGYQWTSITDRSGVKAKQDFPAIKAFSTLEDMLKDDELELVVITTPNETHYPFARKCLEAGKHVVLEKPFTITTDEGKALVELAASGDRILSVYQNRRYVSDFLTIRQLLASKVLGEVHEFEAHYDRYRSEARPGAWREAVKPGSGIFYDLGPHLLDQVFCLFGLPLSVTADIRQQRPHARVDDFFNLWLDYPFGKVILHAGMLMREPGPRYMIHGTKGSFIKYGEDVQEAKLRAGELPLAPDWGLEPEDFHGLLHTETNGKIIRQKYPSLKGDYRQYYRNLYETIVNKAPVKEKPEHGYNTIRLIELAFESHRRKCTVPCNGFMEIDYPDSF
jgi:scyllo-inositol 2-dehydrogenase (NADP+)